MQQREVDSWFPTLELPSVSSILAQMRRCIPNVHMRIKCTQYFTLFFSVTSSWGYANSENHLDGNLLKLANLRHIVRRP